MDHSVRGYLSRQSTQVLLVILRTCLQDNLTESYLYAINPIVEILTDRGIALPQDLSDRICEIQLLSNT